MVGAAPWTAQAVIGRAFHEASERKASVRAVRVWSAPRVDLGWLRPDRIAEWDRAEQRVRHELELALSAWTIIHPEVILETIIVQDRPASFLVAISHSAQLLVLGRTARGAQVAEIAGSPIDACCAAPPAPSWSCPPTGRRARRCSRPASGRRHAQGPDLRERTDIARREMTVPPCTASVPVAVRSRVPQT